MTYELSLDFPAVSAYALGVLPPSAPERCERAEGSADWTFPRRFAGRLQTDLPRGGIFRLMKGAEERAKSALIAMSGGVDSSAAAQLVFAQGFRCEGATMRLYRNEALGQNRFHSCCSEQDIEDASEVAFQLDIPFSVLDFTEEFQAQVIEKFIGVYEAGGTPNPCIDCNRYLKFGRLMEAARMKGLEYVVTGHYARIEYDAESGRYLLRKALDEGKDQSYVLYGMTQEQLAHTLFPLGGLTKAQVREIARAEGFCNARKHDSQDICFAPDRDYVGFMERYTGKTYPAGDFRNVEGQVLGQHQGAVRYTLGQRKGLGLSCGKPVYVCGKNMSENTVTVGEEADLYTRTAAAADMNWIAFEKLEAPRRMKAKTRYRQQEQWASVYPLEGNRVRIEFDEPQRAVTPGQAVVLYQQDIVLGGGTIVFSG